MRITPNNIKSLKDNEIFVFGSNESGIHGAGAAKLAKTLWGAIYGKAEGIQGRCYAIPTKNKDISKTLSVDQIQIYVDNFINFAKCYPTLIFLVTEIGCGLAGLTPKQVAPLFKNSVDIENIYLPESFWKELL